MNYCQCCGAPSARSFPAEALRRRIPALAPAAGHPGSSARPGATPNDNESHCKVLTLGHSTRPIQDFIELLVQHGVTLLIDVRTVARSRHNPQFNEDVLTASLATANIGYAHASGLGGFRATTPDSPNAGWRNLSFRGYADYMQTIDFTANLASLIELARIDRLALMCAEAVPWRCHRSLIADALLVHGIETCEIVSPWRLQPHKMTPFARVQGEEITYPFSDP